jgi:hypothetical protein
MIMKIKSLKYILTLVLLTFGLGFAIAQQKVVVVPLGSSSLSTNTSLSIPVSSLHTGGATVDPFDAEGRLKLPSAFPKVFGTTFVIPGDHRPGSPVFVDIHVYNPAINGDCTAEIDAFDGFRYRVGSAEISIGQFSSVNPFPNFSSGDTTVTQTYKFADDVAVGDAIIFYASRAFNGNPDRCDEIYVVGVNVRYTRQ